MTRIEATTQALLAPPAVPWASEVLDLVTTQEPASVAHHSIRSWAFARLLAQHEGLTSEVDDALLFAATVLHDIGLRRGAREPVRFEVDGADVAARLLTSRGVVAADVDRVWEAIALHTSPGIAERRGPLAYLVREGVGMDFGRGADIVPEGLADALHEAHPRLAMVRSLVDAIVEQCVAVPARGPRFSCPGELTREREQPPHVTEMERSALASRWGS